MDEFNDSRTRLVAAIPPGGAVLLANVGGRLGIFRRADGESVPGGRVVYVQLDGPSLESDPTIVTLHLDGALGNEVPASLTLTIGAAS